MIIGLTGGSGCGKTTALQVLRELGAAAFDADAVYRELLRSDRELLDALDRAFPGAVVNGELQRKALAKVVFQDPQKLATLNAITHPRVREAIRSGIQSARRQGAKLFVIDAFGLMEGNLGSLCDHTVAVLAPREARISRLILRDKITRQEAERRLNAQKSDREFSEACEFTLYNCGTEEEFRQQCRSFFAAFINKEETT